jgi:hypothetical protein
MKEPTLTKLSFGFTEDDMVVINRILEILRIKYGKVPYVTAIRASLREYADILERTYEKQIKAKNQGKQ